MINQIASLIRKLQAEEGQALAEYGLILAFVAALAVATLVALGGALGIPFGQLTDVLPG